MKHLYLLLFFCCVCANMVAAQKQEITTFALEDVELLESPFKRAEQTDLALDGSKGDRFYTVDYEIPADIVKNAKDDVLVTKFVAHEGSIAGGIYHVRLLREMK